MIYLLMNRNLNFFEGSSLYINYELESVRELAYLVEAFA